MRCRRPDSDSKKERGGEQRQHGRIFVEGTRHSPVCGPWRWRGRKWTGRRWISQTEARSIHYPRRADEVTVLDDDRDVLWFALNVDGVLSLLQRVESE